MQHLREILRQKLALGRSHRHVATSLGISPSTVAVASADARSLGLDAAAVEALTDAELEALMYPKPPPACLRPAPDCAVLHVELRRPGVTLALLHVEFLAAHPDGLRYTAFCDRYREWAKRRSPVMRQVHIAGDKLFVDYAGMKPRIVDPVTVVLPRFCGHPTRPAMSWPGGVHGPEEEKDAEALHRGVQVGGGRALP